MVVAGRKTRLAAGLVAMRFRRVAVFLAFGYLLQFEEEDEEHKQVSCRRWTDALVPGPHLPRPANHGRDAERLPCSFAGACDRAARGGQGRRPDPWERRRRIR